MFHMADVIRDPKFKPPAYVADAMPFVQGAAIMQPPQPNGPRPAIIRPRPARWGGGQQHQMYRGPPLPPNSLPQRHYNTSPSSRFSSRPY